MAMISDAARITRGILQPKTSYRFRLRFSDQLDNELEYSDRLASQVVACSSFKITDGPIFGIPTETITIKFEDDIINQVWKGLSELRTETCTIVIDYLDGDGEVLMMDFIRGAGVREITRSPLAYDEATKPNTIEVEFYYDSVDVSIPETYK